MPFTIALNFEDGVTRFVVPRDGETVCDASYRSGINIPMDCRDGVCGTCKVRVEGGSFVSGEYIEDALTDEEAAEGYGLGCQMRATSDLVLAVAASADACKTKAAAQTATVSSVRRLSDTSLAFALRLEVPIPFLPGQYVNIAVPGSAQKRSYSFASAPGASEATFLMRDIPGGLMSGFIGGDGALGAAVALTGPVGSFYLREVRRPVLMLAGGTGLAPFLSMLSHLTPAAARHPIHLVYGVTRDADLVEVAALQEAAVRLPGFSFACCVADPDSAAPLKGYVTDHLAPEQLNGGDVDVYLCGPPAMVEAVRGAFAARGVVPRSFHFEKFSASGVVGATA